MTERAHARPLATAEDLAAYSHHEVIGGEIVEKASPSGQHSRAQTSLGVAIFSDFDGPAGTGPGPGGWWIMTEVEIELAPHEVFRPDIAGWRVASSALPPAGMPVRVRPDWVCEVLSPSTAHNDLGPKRTAYHQAGIGHYWVIDLEHAALTVLRWHETGYVVAGVVDFRSQVRLEPFEAVELDLGRVFRFQPGLS
jgi:Uma2 family endonuclease